MEVKSLRFWAALFLSLALSKAHAASGTAKALSGWKTPLIPRKLLFAGTKHAYPLVSPDGTKLAYLAPHLGRLNIWVRTLGASDDRPLTDYQDHGVRYMFWQFNSEALLYYRDMGGNEHYQLFQARLVGGAGKVMSHQAEYIYDVRLSPRFPDKAQLQVRTRHSDYYLYNINLESGVLEPLEKAEGRVWPDNDFRPALAMEGSYGTRFKARPKGKAWRSLFKLGVSDIFTDVFGFSADNKSAYVGASLEAGTSQLFQIDLETGKRRVIVSDPRHDIESVLFDPKTLEPEAASFYRGRRHWQFFNERSKRDFAVLSKAHPGDIWVLSRDLQARFWTVAYVRDEAPEAYFLYDREQAWAGPLFTERHGLEAFSLAQTYEVAFFARDGMQLFGYLSLPRGLPPRKLPLVLLVHGGPWHRDKWGFDPELQWLCNRGYAVLQVNFRGSTGYGKDYLNAGNGEWGGKMSTDLLDAKKWAVEKGYADPDKVGIFGASYGGYAALAGLAFSPKEFRCGVDICGPSSLQTLFQYLTRYHAYFGATIIDHRVGRLDAQQNLLRQRSPLNSAGAIEAPVFIAQGRNDTRVPRRESEQMVKALKRRGKDVKYVVFPDEGHGFEKWENQLSLNEQVEEFLAAHLGGRLEEGVHKNLDKADSVELYAKDLGVNLAAIELGRSAAMVALGDRHMAGKGVTRSAELAKDWYKKAADLGDMAARGRFDNLEALASTWFDKKHVLPAGHSDFKNLSGTSNWGQPWRNFQDQEKCGTKTFYPPQGRPAVDTVAVNGVSETAGHFAGHYGGGTEDCNFTTWITLACDFLPGAFPLDFAEAGVPDKGFFCKLMLGPRHPPGRQDYVVLLHRFSITPDMYKNKGHDYVLIIPSARLSSSKWTEIRVDFPAKGSIEVQPSKTFAQPDWAPKEARVPWDTNDIYSMDFGVTTRSQDFDFYVKDIGFY